MNFFGHAAVACLVDRDPAFLLGAMAPDLLGMCGVAAGPATSDRVAAGLAHHLTVDAAFHTTPAFLSLQLWAVRALREAGVRRGPARGAAHIGIELLLDGVLAADQRARAAYRQSLASAQSASEPFVWPGEAARTRWRSLIDRLRRATIPDDYRDPGLVADRVARALSRRPRLALTVGEAAALGRFMPSLQRRVIAEGPALSEVP